MDRSHVELGKPDVIIACDPLVREAADSLARRWGVTVLKPREQRFASTGESAVWLPRRLAGAHVLLVASMREDVHSALFRLLMLSGSLAAGGVDRANLLIPLLPYARSDKKPGRRAVPGREVFLDALFNGGIDHIFTVDLHSPPSPGHKDRLTSLPALSAVLATLNDAEPSARPRSVVLPDGGAARRISGPLPVAEVVVADKTRVGDNVVRVSFPPGVRLSGQVMIIDDALFTGATHVEVAAAARRLGANDVHLIVTHALPQPLTLERLADAGVSSLTHLGTTPWAGTNDVLTVRRLAWWQCIPVDTTRACAGPELLR